jgi:septal ring-binding cell division protein DamX
VKPPEPPKAAKPAEKPAVQSPEVAATQADDVAWVRQLQDDAWVMQHAAFDSLSEARSFQASSLGYRSGQVFFTQRKGSKPYYILITGPYADKAQAEALMRQNPPLAKAWLRSAKALKIQFQD